MLKIEERSAFSRVTGIITLRLVISECQAEQVITLCFQDDSNFVNKIIKGPLRVGISIASAMSEKKGN